MYGLLPVPAWAQAGAAVSVPWPLFIAVAALVAAAVVGVVMLMRRRSNRNDPDVAAVPPLLFPAAPASQPRPVRPARPRAASAALESPGVPIQPAPREPWPAPAPTIPPAATVAPPPEPPVTGSWVEGKTIRFHRPFEGTLQIMPGRLDIVGGADKGKSIRFVRTGDPAQITFGRSDGPAYQHIQLRAPTVSRKHALMTFEDARWSICNLSGTNPVVVNGEELPQNSSARPLQDGDHIEMGEITFVFRER